jgi:hypothetical protein
LIYQTLKDDLGYQKDYVFGGGFVKSKVPRRFDLKSQKHQMDYCFKLALLQIIITAITAITTINIATMGLLRF